MYILATLRQLLTFVHPDNLAIDPGLYFAVHEDENEIL